MLQQTQHNKSVFVCLLSSAVFIFTSQIMSNQFVFQSLAPPPELSDFVESFWLLKNLSDQEQDMVIMPDGRVDLFFTYSDTEPFQAMLMNLDLSPSQNTMPGKTVIFAISLKLLAIEYFLNTSISDLPEHVKTLPQNFLGITLNDLSTLEHFTQKTTLAITEQLKTNIDERKRRLFRLLYASNGSITVKELADKVHWTSRQINRYFTQRFGIPLKTYANILRFKASFEQIKAGKLFPEQDFADQSHFIKEVKKYAGVNPKSLAKNQNDRFIQLLNLPRD